MLEWVCGPPREAIRYHGAPRATGPETVRVAQDLGDRTSAKTLRMRVGRNGFWRAPSDHDTVESVKHASGGFFFKQRVYVTVKKSCTLGIKDATGDVYSLTCIRTGEHYVDYNSSDPTIVEVRIL